MKYNYRSEKKIFNKFYRKYEKNYTIYLTLSVTLKCGANNAEVRMDYHMKMSQN